MDSLRAFEDEPDYGSAHDEVAIEAPPEIGLDERRMHVRAYNYWVSLLDGRPYPSINDLDPATLGDFGPHSVLLDFSEGGEDPGVAWLGGALRDECSLTGEIRRISEVPKRSLLSRLTDHYLQIIANRAPIGFEAEFVSQGGRNTMYRGILMPFSSSGDTIDFIYGVINWKEIAGDAVIADIAREAERALAAVGVPAVEASPVWADGPNAEPLLLSEVAPDGDGWDELADGPEAAYDAEAGLADRLDAARACAEVARGAASRSRLSLYRALGLAYAFARATEVDQDGYRELLEDAGVKAQARAPMTPVVKLVFGADYDKARLTEFAAALSWARRESVPIDGFRAYLESFDGGLKGVVQAERQARRPEPKSNGGDAARETLRRAPALAHLELDTAEEFVLILARREAQGRVAVIGTLLDPALTDRAIKKAAA
ncbi:hypothetical protein [Sphingosinicella sp. BN140058]|uniref:PAS domain-containing protein n=1 Tax=Sphingosinicella sp. BN140058 TaxID=1892855 RepID=UPI0010134DC7|nr:hypothetical protein [Sphingosinicella sp. BN140058]QAY77418.1 hypothetical protein ETR14_13555 [Sphingosinicella sp. BN140058]